MSDAAAAVKDYEAAARSKLDPAAADAAAARGKVVLACRAKNCTRVLVHPADEPQPEWVLCRPCAAEKGRVEDNFGAKKKCPACRRRNRADAVHCARCDAPMAELELEENDE